MMFVTPTINGLAPSNTVELNLVAGKVLGSSSSLGLDCMLTLSGHPPAKIIAKMTIVNNDIYRFEDGTFELFEDFLVNIIKENIKIDFRVKNIAFVKPAPRLQIIIYTWEINTGDGMADAAAATFLVKFVGNKIKFTRFK